MLNAAVFYEQPWAFKPLAFRRRIATFLKSPVQLSLCKADWPRNPGDVVFVAHEDEGRCCVGWPMGRGEDRMLVGGAHPTADRAASRKRNDVHGWVRNPRLAGDGTWMESCADRRQETGTGDRRQETGTGDRTDRTDRTLCHGARLQPGDVGLSGFDYAGKAEDTEMLSHGVVKLHGVECAHSQGSRATDRQTSARVMHRSISI